MVGILESIIGNRATDWLNHHPSGATSTGVLLAVITGVAVWKWLKSRTQEPSVSSSSNVQATGNVINQTFVISPALVTQQAVERDVVAAGIAIQPPPSARLTDSIFGVRHSQPTVFDREKPPIGATDARKSLNVEFRFIENGLSGTPGVHIKGINREATAIERAVLTVTNILWWDESQKRFVTIKEVHGEGTTFDPIDFDRTTLHPGSLEQLGFVRADGGRLEIIGRRKEDPQSHQRWKTPGGWQVSFRLTDQNGRDASGDLYLWWGGTAAIIWTPPIFAV